MLVDIIRKIKYLPCIFNKEPFFPTKYEFANQVIKDWNLTVYDFPPMRTFIQSIILEDDKEEIEIVNYYECG
ncbi:MAG: hypothetical protein HC908_03755, partial [Calothrix sp. SM1_7_51]|nr:hypothetical protein [Calothrix sp. SM1_7_51]